MTDIQTRHLEQLQSENVRLARNNHNMTRQLKYARRQSFANSVFCVICIGLAAAGGGLWWAGNTERTQQAESIAVLSANYEAIADSARATERATQTLSSLWPLTIRGLAYALTSEQGKAGTLDMMNRESQSKLEQCYRESSVLRGELYDLQTRLDRAQQSAQQARSRTFTGNVDTGD